MKECAIVRNGTDIIKVSNLKRKYNKIINNPNMEILEECSKDELDTLYASYKEKNSKIEELVEESNSNKFFWHWNVPNTKIWFTTDLEPNEFKKTSCWRFDYVLKTKEEYYKAFGWEL